MSDESYQLCPIGWAEPALLDPKAALRQGDEGSPDAWLVLDLGGPASDRVPR